MLVARHGKVVLEDSYGLADIAGAGTSIADDALVRIYSMTKPVTCVAALLCYEANCFQLDDPVAKFLPEFAEMEVYEPGDQPRLVPAAAPITIRHLFTHTSGIGDGDSADLRIKYLLQMEATSIRGGK